MNAETTTTIVSFDAPLIQVANPKPLEAWHTNPERPSLEWDASKLG